MAHAKEILIVDDEVGIRELLSEILQDEGYRVALAGDHFHRFLEVDCRGADHDAHQTGAEVSLRLDAGNALVLGT